MKSGLFFKSLNMKNLVLLFGLLIGFSGVLYGQEDYDSHTLLLQFEDGTTQDEIDQLREEFNCEEVWVSPLSKTHLWRVESFPFVLPGSADNIGDINELKKKGEGRSVVDEGSLNYYFSTPSEINNSIPDPEKVGPMHSICLNRRNIDQSNINTIKLCIMDTGIYPTNTEILSNVVSGKGYTNSSSSHFDDNVHGTKLTQLNQKNSQ